MTDKRQRTPLSPEAWAARRPIAPWLLLQAEFERPPIPPSKSRIALALRVSRSPSPSSEQRLALDGGVA